MKKGNQIKRFVLLTSFTLLALSTKTMADNSNDLGEINIIDESAKSTLFQREKIVGCTDYGTKKELSCAKAPKDAILSKLPTSQQLSSTDFEDEEEKEGIKTQLSSILSELNELRKEQKADRATIKQLRSLIALLSDKKITSSSKIKSGIQKIAKKQNKSRTATIIRKKIKEVSRTKTEVVVEVQQNESLSTYAQAFYGDNTKYYKIYKANRDQINKNMQIIIGQQLSIPLN